MTTPPPAPPIPPAGNRRNYYRVLHVQPEAPLEVIKASYRTLMSTLRQHPDLGGDHAAAALLNEAWAVLSDPQRRAAYDKALADRVRRARAAEASAREAETAKAQAAMRAARERQARQEAAATDGASPAASAPAQDAARPACPFCHAPHPLPVRIDSRCPRCDAPLAALPDSDRAGHELFGRRGSVRRDRSQVARMLVAPGTAPVAVRWRDISLTGLSVYAMQPVAAGQLIRITDDALDVVAQVVSSRASGQAWSVHARLRTACFVQTSGVFVSARA